MEQGVLLIVGFAVATLVNVILSTLKNVITIKGGRMAASIVNAISQGFNTIVIKSISNVELWIAVIVTILSNLVGVYIALTVIKKFEKERLWKITISVPTEHLHEIKQELHEKNISFITFETNYDKYKVIDIFSNTKKESSIVKKIISKYNIKYTINANDGIL